MLIKLYSKVNTKRFLSCLKKSITSLCIAILLPITTLAIDLGPLHIGGSYLGLFNTMSPVHTRSQFDFATNLDFEFVLQPNLKGIVQLQSGAGKGSLGFVGPGAELTDIAIEYTSIDSNTVLTMGSFDLPLGKGVESLTNNGDAFQSPFVMNSLTYSALAGPVGTLNSLGIKIEKNISGIETTIALTNGTGENATNYGNNFLGLVSVGTNKLAQGLYVGASYTASDDSQDPEESNSFASKFSAWLLDFNYDVTNTLTFKSHFGQFRYDDDDTTTQDYVSVFKIETQYTLSNLFFSARYSAWIPQDDNGNNSEVSSDITNPGLSLNPVSDSSIYRWQLGIGYILSSNLQARAELFTDNYQHGNNTNGIILAFNGRF